MTRMFHWSFRNEWVDGTPSWIPKLGYRQAREWVRDTNVLEDMCVAKVAFVNKQGSLVANNWKVFCFSNMKHEGLVDLPGGRMQPQDGGRYMNTVLRELTDELDPGRDNPMIQVLRDDTSYFQFGQEEVYVAASSEKRMTRSCGPRRSNASSLPSTDAPVST